MSQPILTALIVPSHNNPPLLWKCDRFAFQVAHYIKKSNFRWPPWRFITSLLYSIISPRNDSISQFSPVISCGLLHLSLLSIHISSKACKPRRALIFGWLYEVYIPLDPIFIHTQIISSISFVKPKICRNAIFKVAPHTMWTYFRKKNIIFDNVAAETLWICCSTFRSLTYHNPLHLRISIDSCSIYGGYNPSQWCILMG